MKKMIKLICTGLFAAFWIALMAVSASAAEARVLEQSTHGTTLYTFVVPPDGAQATGMSIGGTEAENLSVSSDNTETGVLTWLVFDNSDSMPESARPVAEDILLRILGETSRNETYNFATFSDHIDVKIRSSSSFSDIKTQIDGMRYLDQPSDLMGALDELLADQASRHEDKFIRIIVISDGGDTIPNGKTMADLRQRFSAFTSNIPIYTIGCSNGINDRVLPQMYALSTDTGAKSWDLYTAGGGDIAKSIHGPETPVLISATVPAALRNGSSQDVQVTFSNGAVIHAAAVMPYEDGTINDTSAPVQVQESAPEQPAAVESEPESDDDDDGPPILLIVLIILLVLMIAGLVVVLVVRPRPRQNPVIARQGPPPGARTGGYHPPAPVPDRKNRDYTPSADPYDNIGGGSGGETEVFGHNMGSYTDGGYYESDNEGENGGTSILGANNDNPRMLYLQDLNHPERRFSASLRDRVTIGRNANNRIVLDYGNGVSREHCVIYAQGSSYFIQDLNSANGVSVDGVRISDAVEIFNGNTIRLGNLNFEVRIR